MKNKGLVVFLNFIFFLIYSCNSSETGNFKKLSSGLEYKIIETKGSSARKLKLGDVINLNYSYETEDGKVLFSSLKSNRKYLRKVEKSAKTHGSIEDGFLILREGDSAIFKIQADKFLLFSEGFEKLPKGVKATDNIIVKLRVIEIIDPEEYEDILLSSYHKDKETEMNILKNYLQNSNITVTPTESGLYYVEYKKGTGPRAEKGKYVTVDYTVKYIDGQIIETTLGKQPFIFRLGDGQVIAGWEEGISYMNEGGKAMLIIPSDLAYGENGRGAIRPYSTLVFEVDLLKVK